MRGEPTGFWAKLGTDREDGTAEWHPLRAHCADVAAVTESLIGRTALGRRLARLLGVSELSQTQRDRICVLAALHDAGKANHGFQRRGHGHVGPLVDFLRADGPTKREFATALGLGDMKGWFSGPADLVSLLLATFCHHGQPRRPGPEFRPGLWRAHGERNPLGEVRALRDAAAGWFPAAAEAGESFPSALAFEHAFNGLVTLSDWIASDELVFPYAEDESDRMPFARKHAREAVRRLGLDVGSARVGLGPGRPGFGAVSGHRPRPVQRACADLPDHDAGSLELLESDTGSGKTEAALTRFVQLFHSGHVDGLYFALPTRAAATQLHGRVREAVARAFPDEGSRPAVVLAVPGYLRVDGAEGQRLPEFRVLWDDEESERWRYRGWAAENPKRYLAATIAVGTVDQVLLSALQVRHAHLRATSLLRHLLVVDEVHASDPYMGRLLEEVLRQHLAAGGHVLLMSATLGAASQSRLFGGRRAAPPPLHEAISLPYPLVTHRAVDGETQRVEAKPSGYSKQVVVEAQPVADRPEQVAALALDAAREGARVLVIRNTVSDCVATQRALEGVADGESGLLFGAAGVAAPHHSRFAAADRRLLDRAIEADFGGGSVRRGVAAVATQTVEQSLDIDADLLVTDLCPGDVLLQRIGRLHRHPEWRPPRSRPQGCRVPRCVVLVPTQRTLGGWIGGDGRARGPHGLGTVYEDLRVLEATWRLIEGRGEWTIPGMNREIVERATHPEPLSELAASLGGHWPEHQNHIIALRSAGGIRASVCLLPRDRHFGEVAFPDDPGELIKTRLGEGDRLAEFEAEMQSPFGAAYRRLELPYFYAPDAAQDAVPIDATSQDGVLRFEFGGRSFVYSRLGLHPADAPYLEDPSHV